MTIEFCEAKDGNATCKCNGLFLHSAYKPIVEAQKFCKQLTTPFKAKYILITEPGISYCAEFLKERFPEANICAVRFTKEFSKYDSKFDKVFYIDFTENRLSEELFSYMGEEGLFSCFFTSWNSSEKIFKEESSFAWKEIKKAVVKSNQVLATRSYFAKRWFFNAVRNCIFLNKTCYLQKTDKPVIICASGPSLKNCLPFLKKYEGHYHLFCVSSALAPLVNYNLKPELCITTDGGFFAKKHLSFYASKVPDTVFSIATESAINTSLLLNSTILPLSYSDSPSDSFFKECGIQSSRALRNGTVSGTAAFLALSATTSEVYFCGLDLCETNGFAHTQPNELENTDSLKDIRISSKETRILPQSFKNSSLDVYSSWFSNTDFNGRLYRLSDNYSFKNSLGTVTDINWNFFEQKNYPIIKDSIFIPVLQKKSIDEKKKIIYSDIKKNLHTELYINNILPSDYLQLKRSFENFKENLTDIINTKMNKFFEELTTKFFPDADGAFEEK